MFCSCHSPWKRLLLLAAALLALSWLAVAPATAWAQGPAGYAPAGWDAARGWPRRPTRIPTPPSSRSTITAKLADVEVAPGKRVRAWTYNGSLPGPLIRARSATG